MPASQPPSLSPGKCEQCRNLLGADHFALWYDHARMKRSCHHLVCGTCRGAMLSWRSMRCPNSKCAKAFYAVQDVLCPSTSSSEDFFKFINHSQTGRVTKEELADWYTTNFQMTQEDALNMIGSNWHFWDEPKNYSWLKLGFLRSKDQGDLDKDEFPSVQAFMAESLTKSMGLKAAAGAAVSAPAASSSGGAAAVSPDTTTAIPAAGQAQNKYLVDNSVLRAGTRGLSYRSAKEFTAKVKPEEAAPWDSYVDALDPDDDEWIFIPAKNGFLPVFVNGIRVLIKCDKAAESKGEKRSQPEADALIDGVQRHVRRRMLTKAEELQGKLRNTHDQGRQWFANFDVDKNGKLEKTELINGMLETFKGSHGIAREQITSIVEGIWDSIDTDANGSIDFNEFQMLREAMVAQLCSEKVAQEVSCIKGA
mmetsp:Transcript_160061/g.292178  ORF Transcript_160061/g.292178 Transcript_160061/m.292178 type:complete len:422 (+) Transcript_160061:84-1349(+)